MINTWDYNVELKELRTDEVNDKEGDLLQPRVATVDEESGKILGTVSRRYSLVPNSVLNSAMNEVSEELGLILENIQVVKDKRATIFRYNFGEDRLKVITNSSEPEDKVKFGLEIFNSFDSALGGSRFQFFANRLICLNGLTVPKEVGKFSFKELGAITGTAIKDKLFSKIEPMMAVADTWNIWAQTSTDETKVTEFIASNFSKKVSEKLLETWDSSKEKTQWGLYNLITFYISHEAKSKTSSDLRYKQLELEKIASKMYKINLS